MSNLDRDRLRVIVCFAGLFGLFFQLFAETVFGATIGAGLTGTFGTLATLPVVDSAVERYSSKRQGPPPDPSEPPSLPPPPTYPEVTATQPPPSDPPQEHSRIESLAVAV